MSLRLIGKKKGMTQLFDKEGNVVVCTVILAEPHVVCQVKSETKDGYNAIQLGSVEAKKNVSKPLKGHFAKANVKDCRYLVESRMDKVDEYQIGGQINVSSFKEGDMVDVSGISIGKGYQGLMKLYHFKGGPKSHGSGFHRHAGSTGMRTSPGRCFAGGKRPGRMGADTVTMQNLKVVKVDEARNAILVSGSIPGCFDGLVYISKANKKK